LSLLLATAISVALAYWAISERNKAQSEHAVAQDAQGSLQIGMAIAMGYSQIDHNDSTFVSFFDNALGKLRVIDQASILAMGCVYGVNHVMRDRAFELANAKRFTANQHALLERFQGYLARAEVNLIDAQQQSNSENEHYLTLVNAQVESAQGAVSFLDTIIEQFDHVDSSAKWTEASMHLGESLEAWDRLRATTGGEATIND
jgi:hypothetical protein